MNYTVIWKPSAEALLAKIWSSDPQQQLIADAANSIDKLLATSPLDVGES